MALNLLLLNEAIEVEAFTTLQGVFWAINLSLYFLCTQRLYFQYCNAPDDWNKLILPFICDSIMVLATGVELACNTRAIQLGFIDHGGVHAEPVAFLDSTPSLSPIYLIPFIASFTIFALNSIVQLRRIWIMWGMSSYKLALTIFLSFLAIVTQTLVSIDTTAPTLTRPEEIAKFEILATVSFALNLAFTLLVTLLLVGRIIVMRRRHNRLMGTTSENAMQYTSVIAILIESYALDSVWNTGAMITFALSLAGSPVKSYDIFNDTGDQVTVFAFLLVRYRVLLGRAWTPETGTQISSLRWNHNDPVATRTTDRAVSPGNLLQVTTESHMVADKKSLRV